MHGQRKIPEKEAECMSSLFAKGALQSAFVELLNEEPFDKITVVDITRLAGVSRNTFYYWYSDVYALLDDLFFTQTQSILQDDRKFGTWQEGFRHATQFALQNKKAIYHLYHSIGRDKLQKFLYEVTYNDLRNVMLQQSEGLDVRPEAIRDLAAFYTSALVGLTVRWLDGGMKQDPDEYLESMEELLNGNIRSALERGCRRNVTD
jgi:AcrR family transcriptional regulator